MRIRIIAALAMCMLAAAAASQASAKVLREGDTGDEVAVIQQALTDLELYYADVTGHFGKKTAAAVKKFQRKHRLDETGIADDETWRVLCLAADVELKEEKETSFEYDEIMRQGSQGRAVRLLQEQLAALDYYDGTVTGSYGRLTREAVRLFQRDHDLSSDGVAGPRTLEKIRRELGDEEPKDKGGGDCGEAGGNEETKENPKKQDIDFEAVKTLNTAWTLRRSSRSGYVKRLQSALAALGYFTDKIDGRFGVKTEEAVRLYQQVRGLTIDGVAGRATLRSINEDIENRRPIDRAEESID